MKTRKKITELQSAIDEAIGKLDALKAEFGAPAISEILDSLALAKLGAERLKRWSNPYKERLGEKREATNFIQQCDAAAQMSLPLEIPEEDK